MPKPTGIDHQRTRKYIPILSTQCAPPLSHNFQRIETHCIHQGRIVFSDFEDINYLNVLGSYFCILVKSRSLPFVIGCLVIYIIMSYVTRLKL